MKRGKDVIWHQEIVSAAFSALQVLNLDASASGLPGRYLYDILSFIVR